VFSKKIISILGLALCIGISGLNSAEAEKVDNKQQAKKFLQFISTNKFAEAVQMGDSKMQAAMSPAQLEQLWQQLQGQLGKMQSLGEGECKPIMNMYEQAIIPGNFEKGKKDFLVTCDSNGKVAGFFIKDHASPLAEPPYANKNLFEEIPVKVGTGSIVLDGTLSLPKGAGPFPAVVLVHGSGAHDRDETVGASKPFRDIAFGLASNGIAVLRYEKRNYRHAKEMIAQLTTMTVKEETIDDAIEAVKVLREQKKIDPNKIFVLGHSLGGYLIPRIAMADPKLAGVISMAGSTRPTEDLVIEQFAYLHSLKLASQEQVDKGIADAKTLKDPSFYSSDKTVLGAPAFYWKDLQGYDPAKLGAELKMPILVIQGESDFQVTMKGDFSRWKNSLANHSNATLKSYPGLCHLFTKAGNPPSPLDYEKAQNVDAQVVDDIASWIKTSSRR
jgi:dienelactone hydrolase